ncbi:MAG: hypothetical protein EPO02_12800 [Nitrospirae bacterium]|nr:MAG: hypothetical protein EPO02_12800 [Nitrospirota bacterium]
MPAPNAKQQITDEVLKIVGGNHFGRYDKVSVEQTWNMITSDGFLVPYAGYKNVSTVNVNSPGRVIYQSHTANAIFAVWGNQFFKLVGPEFVPQFKGTLATSSGDVYISENNNKQIAITDYTNLYVYSYADESFQTSTTGAPGPNQFPVSFVHPGAISFQNGRLIVADTQSQRWYLSEANKATIWPNTGAFVGALQSKPDTIQAVVPVPGGGNNALVFGHDVVEIWQDVGNALFPYQKQSSLNIDYGCLNASSIAALETHVVWLAANERSGPTIMVFQGNTISSITTDGMDFKFSDIKNPTNCTGFLFRQDGHLLYQFTFPDANLSYVHDFNSHEFFTVTDENLNYHPARNAVFYNNFYYFVSLKGGNLYEFGTQFTNIEYASDNIQQIPRIRICPPYRLPTQRMFIIKSIAFTIEQGQPNTIEYIPFEEPIQMVFQDDSPMETQDDKLLVLQQPFINDIIELASEAVDLSISRDGGENFGNALRLDMNPTGVRRSRFIFQRLGQANDCSVMLEFTGFSRFVVTDGVMEVYQ